MGSNNEDMGVAPTQPADRTPLVPAKAEVVKLKDWLGDTALHIPSYQRPYKWGDAQVQQLLSDIEHQAQATTLAQGAHSYRMGTVVVHIESVETATDQGDAPAQARHHIVDGQQRTVTLLLVLHALRAVAQVVPEAQRPGWQLDLLVLDLFEPQFPSPLSHQQVQANYQTITRHIRQAQWGQAQVAFLLERCEVVRVQLHSLTEAFQFFDAQNGRGKALCVHDLLKAFHLRALRPAELPLRGQAVQAWEQCTESDLERLFARFLFQTRQRSRSRSAEFFGKRHVGVFKGISLDGTSLLPMAQTWRMLDEAVHEQERQSGKRGKIWPCQLDAPVVNGLRFFDWVQHYWLMGFHLPQAKNQLPPWTQQLKQPLPVDAQGILLTLGTYAGRDRKGDAHVRAVFDALLMYYLDKFGEQGLSQAVELAFAWAYARLLHRRVQVGSMDKFLREASVNPFVVLRDAVTPQDFLGVALPMACYGNSYQGAETSRPKGLGALQEWMQRLGYWQEEKLQGKAATVANDREPDHTSMTAQEETA